MNTNQAAAVKVRTRVRAGIKGEGKEFEGSSRVNHNLSIAVKTRIRAGLSWGGGVGD